MIETDITRAAKEGLDQIEAQMDAILANSKLDPTILMKHRIGRATMRPAMLALAAEREANADPFLMLTCFAEAMGSVLASAVHSIVGDDDASFASALAIRSIGDVLIRALDASEFTRVMVPIEGVGHA